MAVNDKPKINDTPITFQSHSISYSQEAGKTVHNPPDSFFLSAVKKVNKRYSGFAPTIFENLQSIGIIRILKPFHWSAFPL
jgi:hypothetical protein